MVAALVDKLAGLLPPGSTEDASRPHWAFFDVEPASPHFFEHTRRASGAITVGEGCSDEAGGGNHLRAVLLQGVKRLVPKLSLVNVWQV